MSLPAVTITELDGALGVQPSGEPLRAFIGVSDTGPTAVPAAFARTKDIKTNYTAGPLVEAAGTYVQRTQKPCIVVRTGQTVVGSNGTLVVTGVTGTSVVTLSLGPANDDYEIVGKVVNGGTLGTAGITLQFSYDGGRNFDPLVALGTAMFYILPSSGGIKVNFAAGTLNAGDTFSTRTTAPQWNASELTAAITALKNSGFAWDMVCIVGPIDATAYDALTAAIAAPSEKCWIGHTRIPTIGETEAAYKTALDTIFSAKSTTYGVLCSGAAKVISGVSGRKYLRPSAFSIMPRFGSISDEVDAADPNLGGLGGTDIRDANGNPDNHDESVNPGLDDSRFCVLRTFDGIQGVFVNNPNLHSPSGSDFQYLQHRRVMNRAKAALRIYFTRRLSKPIQVSSATGFILESEALEIEQGAIAALESALRAKPMASGVDFHLSRTDNLLSTKTLTGQGFIVPLAYPKAINLDVGFRNPALALVQV